MLKENIPLSKIHSKSNRYQEIQVIKRDGRIEPYSPFKMRRVVLWACDGNEKFAEDILTSVFIKLNPNVPIKIQDVYDEVIRTAVNKISTLYPEYEKIAAKLYLNKILKETWGKKIAKSKLYPSLSAYIEKAEKSGVLDKKYYSQSYSPEEIEVLSKAIKKERDFIFTYKALKIFHEKYSLKSGKNTRIELPQLTYMRIAMFLFHNEKDREKRLKLVKDLYDHLSTHKYTLATPIMLNAGTPKPQLASCVLITTDDSTESILQSDDSIAEYSRHKGGTSIDISAIRAKGRPTKGNQGISSGPIPFIKRIESTVKAWNQGGSRPGACCAYYQWWHLDVFDLLPLKNNGGTEETRARRLKYAVKINRLFLERVKKNEDIHLFSPDEAKSLLRKYGKEFEEEYLRLENKTGIKKKRVNAREVMKELLKQRFETGNVYIFFEENVNERNQTNRYVGSSNLCTEILEPSRPSKIISEELITRENGEKEIVKKIKPGEIALCNLASINIYEYEKLSQEEKSNIVHTLLRAMDNAIDIQFYPKKEAKNSNQKYRYVGVGVLNFAKLLASKKLIFDSQEALEYAHKVFDELSFEILKTSNLLAKERGTFEGFKETLWSKGILPVHTAKQEALNLTEYKPDIKKWNKLAEEIKNTGVRFALHMAIAPTATSGKAINATESIEPIQLLMYKEDGIDNIPTLVPEFRKYNQYYKKGFDCDMVQLIKHAAIRQIYLDQSQSVNMYVKEKEYMTKFLKLHLIAEKLGLKTLYYVKQPKDVGEEICESCT